MIENLEGEIWKNVGIFKSIDFTGYYEVSNKGRFKSVNRTVICKDGIKRTWKERLLKQCNNNGYLTVYLTKDGKRTSIIAQQVDALRFVENPNPKEYIQINHKDENRANNCAENLEWCTFEYNYNYGSHIERCTKNMVEHAKSRRAPIVQLSLDGRLIKNYDAYIDVEQDGFNSSAVCACSKGKRRTHKGYKWMKLSDYEKMIQQQEELDK